VKRVRKSDDRELEDIGEKERRSTLKHLSCHFRGELCCRHKWMLSRC
jgi:hypothetical protein